MSEKQIAQLVSEFTIKKFDDGFYAVERRDHVYTNGIDVNHVIDLGIWSYAEGAIETVKKEMAR